MGNTKVDLKQLEEFQSNQTIRVLDQIAMDIASLFNTKYHGNAVCCHKVTV